MASETLRATFDETTLANANTAIDAYIDAIWAAVGGTPTDIQINLTININAELTGDTTEYVYSMKLVASNETSTLLKTALDALFAEYEDVASDSSLYDTINTVDGSVSITVNY